MVRGARSPGHLEQAGGGQGGGLIQVSQSGSVDVLQTQFYIFLLFKWENHVKPNINYQDF